MTGRISIRAVADDGLSAVRHPDATPSGARPPARRRGRRTAEQRAKDRAAGLGRHGQPLVRAATHWPGPFTGRIPSTFAAYLRSRRWKYIESWKLTEACGHCDSCGRHRRYLNVVLIANERVGRENPEDVAVLCDRCDERRKITGRFRPYV